MKIVVGAWFRLPRLGTAAFSALMKQGVRYDREMGFMLSSDTDVESAVMTLSGVIGEHVDLTLPCFVCVKGDTLIVGDNKSIQDTQSGDKCIGLTGINKIERQMSRPYEGRMVRLRACGLLPFELTPEHRVLVVTSITKRIHDGRQWRSFSEPYWKMAKELKPKKEASEGDYLILPRVEGSVDLRELDLRAFTSRLGAITSAGKGVPLRFALNTTSAWLLGLYTAEGFTSSTGVWFSLGKHEEELRKRLSEVVRDIGYSPVLSETRTAMCVVLPSRILARAIPAWCGRGASAKRIPEFVLLHEDLGILRAFLDGYAAGDGSVLTDQLSFGTVSKLLALQLQLLCARLGRFMGIYKGNKPGNYVIEGRTVRTKQSYVMSLRPRSKSSYAIVLDRAIATPVRSVSYDAFDGKVYNLETADNTYLVSNAVVHNCLNEACPSCPYLPVCDRRTVSPLCLCAEHSSGADAYRNYVKTFSALAE